ncbi:hypothetical protein TL16_g10528 [Triparma laevis f. inornata]|uniref:Uncharacterized protein n=1 Tax=Triparma laevis f. inornata TaxID=1714386 RepID=A0A9W7EQM0_9STRA|nr:hypothetical protein TL16_g10528 [Triparma laevis f. inornata]
MSEYAFLNRLLQERWKSIVGIIARIAMMDGVNMFFSNRIAAISTMLRYRADIAAMKRKGQRMPPASNMGR